MPVGTKLTKALRGVFKKQRAAVLSAIKKATKALDKTPDWFDQLAWDKALIAAARPAVQLYVDKGGKDALARLGFSDAFNVTAPNVKEAIDKTTFDLSTATNATTRLQLDKAYAKLAEDLTAGIIAGENTVKQLTEAVNAIFENADKKRAQKIAQTESSRAVHRGQRMAALQSGVVKGFKLLLSTDPCKLCIEVAIRHKQGISLDGTFGEASTYKHGSKSEHPTYGTFDVPPLHPDCQCTLVEIIDTAALKKEA